jgi:KDO2-lipid IV(A) lauroyltransferase
MIGNVALYLALRLAALLLPLLPFRVASALASVAGWCAYLLFPIPRRQISRNLSIVLGAPASSPLVRRAARTAFQNDARNWVDTLRIGRIQLEDIERALEIEPGGWERLVAAHEEGNGVILVTLHLGNYDLVGQLLALRGYALTVPVEHMRPPALYDFLTRERRSQGINTVPVEQAPRALLRAIRAGEMVAIAGDRAAAGRRVEVQLFGHTAALPRGPVSLARRTGAPVIVACGVRRDGGYRGIVSDQVPIQRTGDAEADDRENAQRLAGVFEDVISRFPDQWLMFDNPWRDGSKHVATMLKTEEATV